MKIKYLLSALLFLTIVLVSCTKEYDCTDLAIQPVFIGFAQSDIDTFVLKRFKQNSNYQNLIDTFVVRYGEYSAYRTINDTTTVFVANASNDGTVEIKAGYDWQIFIPSKNKTVFVSGIVSEKATGKHHNGIFNTDKVGNCINRIFSVKTDNQVINFSAAASYYILIRN